MLTFFRKIRKSLIDSSSARKPASSNVERYLLYAIGEILLVMIGILLALQVNNWNEWRKDREKERWVLLQISETCKENREILKNGITLLNRCNTSSQIVLAFLNDSIPYSDTLAFHFYKAVWPLATLFSGISNSGYEALKYSGFELILNENVRKQIISLFEKTLSDLVFFGETRSSVDIESDWEFMKRNFRSFDQGLLPINHHEIMTDNYYR